MKRILPLSIAILALVGVSSWWFSPAEVVKRRTKTLLRTLTLEAGSGVAGRQMGTYSLNALLAPEIRLENATIPQANGAFSREEVESAFSWLCNQAKQTDFRVDSFRQVRVEQETAEVDVRIFGMVELPNYRPADGFHDAVFQWKRFPDGWRLASAHWAGVSK